MKLKCDQAKKDQAKVATHRGNREDEFQVHTSRHSQRCNHAASWGYVGI